MERGRGGGEGGERRGGWSKWSKDGEGKEVGGEGDLADGVKCEEEGKERGRKEEVGKVRRVGGSEEKGE